MLQGERKIRLAIAATHPIQYCAPVFRRLTERGNIQLKVFYGWEGATRGAFDHGFAQKVQWDIPLLEGYQYAFVPNRSKDPGTHHHRGIDCPELVSVIRAWNPDAILVYGWNYRSHLQLIRTFSGRRTLYFRGDSTLLDEIPGPRKLLRRGFLKWVYRHVDCALSVGTLNRDYYLAHGLTPSQIKWVPHSIDNDRFADATGHDEQQALHRRQELGIERDSQVILFAGKLESKKAPDVLVDTFLKMADSNLHLVLAGSGPLETSLRRSAESCKNVHFIGFQNQLAMPAVYRLADIFVLPSRGPGETWGLAVNEAMAAGKPVIVSDRVGCYKDLVRAGKNGYVVPVNEVSGLQSALRQALTDREGLRLMGRASMKIIENWSINAQVRRLEEAMLGQLVENPVT